MSMSYDRTGDRPCLSGSLTKQMHRGRQLGDRNWLSRSLTTHTSETHHDDRGMLTVDHLATCHSIALHAAELAKVPHVHAHDGSALWPVGEEDDASMRGSIACCTTQHAKLGSSKSAHSALLARDCIVDRRSSCAPASSYRSRTARLQRRAPTKSAETAGKVLVSDP